jgi:dipeptidase
MSIEELTKIALERCKTAKCAVKLMGRYNVHK